MGHDEPCATDKVGGKVTCCLLPMWIGVGRLTYFRTAIVLHAYLFGRSSFTSGGSLIVIFDNISAVTYFQFTNRVDQSERQLG